MSGLMTPVMIAPLLDPGADRRCLEFTVGLTLDQIVRQSLPLINLDTTEVRASLVTAAGTSLVPPALWAFVRPKPGVHVVLRVVPGKDALRSVLLIVVSIAAASLGGPLANVFGFAAKSAGAKLVTAGLTIAAQLLVSALIPIQQPDALGGKETYRIDGWQNQIRPGAAVPFAVGKHRYAPPFAAASWTEVVGDEQYVRALFCFGYGPLRLTDLRIGQTPLSDFNDVDIEIREGRPDDAPVSLYPEQVLEESTGVELVRPQPVDLEGQPINSDPSIETPVTRFTASNTARASVIIGLPSGLFAVDDKGRVAPRSVSIRIRARLNGEGDWQDVETIDMTAKKQEAFLRAHTWELSTRGRWQIEVTRMTDDSVSTQVADTVVLSAIQSIRPEYPINSDKPLSLVAVRIRATRQLNGPLDDFNALVEHEGLIIEDDAWVAGYGQTPATAYLSALMGPQNPFPVTETEIDMAAIADWHDWCVLKGLKYNRVHDEQQGLGDMLSAICAAGRATPRQDGLKWGVVIDRPQTLVIDELNPRNSEQFDWSRTYFKAPDGLRVRFLDETNDYEEAERIVPWPGHEGPVLLTESIEMPGKTHPDEIWIEARRRMYELEHRPDSFSAMQSNAARVATRGDLVMGSFDVLERTQIAARVKSVQGKLIELDEDIPPMADWGVRFRVFDDPDDVIGISTVRTIAAHSLTVKAVMVMGSGPMPEAGDLVHLGPIASESIALRVRGVEAAQDFQSRFIMIAAAPEIDALTDAEVPPAWDGRVGAEIEQAAVAPTAPLFSSVATGQVGTGNVDGLEIVLRPGPGSTAIVTNYELDHRLAGAGVWTTVDIPVAACGAAIDAYVAQDNVELRARAIANTTPGDYTTIATLIIGGDDPVLPDALDDETVSVVGQLGHAVISLPVSNATPPASVQIYRAPSGDTFDRDTHAIGTPLTLTAGTTFSYIDGDGTRTNLIEGGQFENDVNWLLGSGWSIAGGKAIHAPGASGALIRLISLGGGQTYRTSFTVLDYTAGTVTPRLTGGVTVNGTAVSAAGFVSDRLTTVSDITEFSFEAASDFEAAIDDLTIFQETATCLDAGAWDYWVEPRNEENIAGPISGPFMTTIK